MSATWTIMHSSSTKKCKILTASMIKVQLCEYENQTLEAFVVASS